MWQPTVSSDSSRTVRAPERSSERRLWAVPTASISSIGFTSVCTPASDIDSRRRRAVSVSQLRNAGAAWNDQASDRRSRRVSPSRFSCPPPRRTLPQSSSSLSCSRWLRWLRPLCVRPAQPVRRSEARFGRRERMASESFVKPLP
eukprot:Mycagemm_TRINITY_DN10217_c0_g1::TRINITY_DN10217_c0_g1_i3::g.3871::m.3871 type:complete len:145 gc:universal TRINITY_DN10217_c0_g1_i3:889-455(-)